MKLPAIIIPLIALLLSFQTELIIVVDPSGATVGSVRKIEAGLAAALGSNRTGQPTRIVIKAGIYRETLNWDSMTDAPFAIEGETETIISGADIFIAREVRDGLYEVDWTQNWGLIDNPKDWPALPEIARRKELVIVDNTRLIQVLRVDELANGAFYVDEPNDKILMKLAAAPKLVEVGVRERVTVIRGANITITGLTFQHGVPAFPDSMVQVNAKHLTLERCTFRESSAGGLGVSRSEDVTTRKNIYANNGSTGYGASFVIGLLSTGDTAYGNNWRGHQGNWRDWNVAGVKHLNSRHATYKSLTTRDNHAHGLWMDFDNQNTLIDGLISRNNNGVGLYLEASPGPITVRGAVIEGNRREGIFASNTAQVTLENNHIQKNRKGIMIGGQIDGRPVTDWQTGVKRMIPPWNQWKMFNNVVMDARWPFQYSPADFSARGLISDFNVWGNQANANQWFLVSGIWRDSSRWRSDTGQDQNSANSPTERQGATSTPRPTSTPTPRPTQTPKQTPTAEPDLSPEEWVIEIDLRLEGSITIRRK